MSTFAVVVVAILVAGIAVLAWEVYIAPEGYEDEDGFHYGTPDKRSHR